jgi:hypothetical protein
LAKRKMLGDLAPSIFSSQYNHLLAISKSTSISKKLPTNIREETPLIEVIAGKIE